MGAFLIALALVGTLVWRLWPSPQTSPQDDASQPPQITEIGVMGGASSAETVVFSPDGRTLAAAFDDDNTRVWNVTSHQQVSQIPASSSNGDPVFSPDSRTLITLDIEHNDDRLEGVVEWWDVANGQRADQPLIIDIRPDPGYAGLNINEELALSPEGRSLAVTTWGEDTQDYSVQLWNIDSREEIGNPILRMWDAVLSPDERTIATQQSEGDYSLALLDLASQQGISCISPRNDGIGQAHAFSSDSGTLVTADMDPDGTGIVQLWDTSVRQLEDCRSEPSDSLIIPDIDSTFGYFRQVALSPDGHIIATINDVDSEGGSSLRLWNADSGQQIGSTIDGINSVAFDPGGRTLATAGEDNTVRLWRVRTS